MTPFCWARIREGPAGQATQRRVQLGVLERDTHLPAERTGTCGGPFLPVAEPGWEVGLGSPVPRWVRSLSRPSRPSSTGGCEAAEREGRLRELNCVGIILRSDWLRPAGAKTPQLSLLLRSGKHTRACGSHRLAGCVQPKELQQSHTHTRTHAHTHAHTQAQRLLGLLMCTNYGSFCRA